MTNLKKFIKKNKSSIGHGAYAWDNESITALILRLADALDKDLISNTALALDTILYSLGLGYKPTDIEWVKKLKEKVKKSLNLKDNPVPSLDIIKELEKHIKSNNINRKSKTKLYDNGFLDCFDLINFLIQNGVTSNKEQPNKYNTINLGYIKEDTYLGEYSCWSNIVKFFIANNTIYHYDGWEMLVSDCRIYI